MRDIIKDIKFSKVQMKEFNRGKFHILLRIFSYQSGIKFIKVDFCTHGEKIIIKNIYF